MLGQMESVLGADSTVQSLCEDIVTHYEKYRANLLTGKAMIVAYSRPIAMKSTGSCWNCVRHGKRKSVWS